MIKAEMKKVPLETRIALGNISKVGQIDGVFVVVDLYKSSWEYASAGLFGKMVKDITPEEMEQLESYSDDEISKFAGKVRVFLGNPTHG